MENAKEMLEAEKMLLLSEIKKIGAKDRTAPGGYAPKETITNADDVNDDVDQASEQENIITNNAILNELEIRLSEVDTALSKIATGTFGVCTKCKKNIEEDRLNVNPSAPTCKEHMEV